VHAGPEGLSGEPAWQASPQAAIEAIKASDFPPDARLIARWREPSICGLAALVRSVLADHFDRLCAARAALRSARTNTLAPQVVESHQPERLVPTIRAWQPIAQAMQT
jgi:hypothetical protein